MWCAHVNFSAVLKPVKWKNFATIVMLIDTENAIILLAYITKYKDGVTVLLAE